MTASPQAGAAGELIVKSGAPEATEALGRRVGALAQAGDVIGLIGDLGAGKTVFVRGLAAGLGADPEAVASPTFIIVAEYRGRLPLHHVDLYRLEPSGVDLLSLREYCYGSGVTVIEWCDRLPAGALDAYLLVRIDYGSPGRRVTFEARGERAAALIASLAGKTKE